MLLTLLMTKTIIIITIFILSLYSSFFLVKDLTSSNKNTLAIEPNTEIELNIFKLNNGSYDLKWKLKNSKNVSHFLIQKSMDEKKFLTVGRVECNGKNKFSFQEYIPDEDIIIYRLVSVSKDGTFILSQKVTVIGSVLEDKYQ